MGALEVIGVLFLTAAATITLAALLTVVTFLLPTRVERTHQVLNRLPRRAFGVGFINFIFFTLLIIWFVETGELGQLIALLILLVLSATTMVGLTAVLALLHERMQPKRPLSQTAVLLILAGLAPGFGWFILTPIALVTGLGAVIITWTQRPAKEPPYPF